MHRGFRAGCVRVTRCGGGHGGGVGVVVAGEAAPAARRRTHGGGRGSGRPSECAAGESRAVCVRASARWWQAVDRTLRHRDGAVVADVVSGAARMECMRACMHAWRWRRWTSRPRGGDHRPRSEDLARTSRYSACPPKARCRQSGARRDGQRDAGVLPVAAGRCVVCAATAAMGRHLWSTCHRCSAGRAGTLAGGRGDAPAEPSRAWSPVRSRARVLTSSPACVRGAAVPARGCLGLCGLCDIRTLAAGLFCGGVRRACSVLAAGLLSARGARASSRNLSVRAALPRRCRVSLALLVAAARGGSAALRDACEETVCTLLYLASVTMMK